jgi:DNA-binding XRE family transcriptional regulator
MGNGRPYSFLPGLCATVPTAAPKPNNIYGDRTDMETEQMIQESQKLNKIQVALGNRIKTLRQQKGWPSQQAFAVACSIDRTHLGQIERGQINACISTLVEIAKKLGMTAADLFENIA